MPKKDHTINAAYIGAWTTIIAASIGAAVIFALRPDSPRISTFDSTALLEEMENITLRIDTDTNTLAVLQKEYETNDMLLPLQGSRIEEMKIQVNQQLAVMYERTNRIQETIPENRRERTPQQRQMLNESQAQSNHLSREMREIDDEHEENVNAHKAQKLEIEALERRIENANTRLRLVRLEISGTPCEEK